MLNNLCPMMDLSKLISAGGSLSLAQPQNQRTGGATNYNMENELPSLWISTIANCGTASTMQYPLIFPPALDIRCFDPSPVIEQQSKDNSSNSSSSKEQIMALSNASTDSIVTWIHERNSGYRTFEIPRPPSYDNDKRPFHGVRTYTRGLCKDFASGFCPFGYKCRWFHESDQIIQRQQRWKSRLGWEEEEERWKDEYDFVVIFHIEGKERIQELSSIVLDCTTRAEVCRYHQFVRPLCVSDHGGAGEVNAKSNAVTLGEALAGMQLELSKLEVDEVAKSDRESHVRRPKTVLFATCGNWDIMTQLPLQCRRNKLQVPHCFREWLNIKDFCMNFYHTKIANCYGMKPLLRFLKIDGSCSYPFGMDKANDIAKVVVRLLEHGAKLKPTAVRLDSGKVRFLCHERVRPPLPKRD